MKILQLIQKPQLRGAEIFACQLSNHLLEMGHEVLVVSIFKGDSELPFQGKIINLNRPLSKRFIDIKGWNEFNNIVKRFNPDIIQANAADTLKFAVSSKLIFSWKNSIIFRNANKMGDFIDSKLKWKLNNFYLSKVKYIISVSNECEIDMVKTFPLSKGKIQTVEIGVEDKILGGVPYDLKSIFENNPIISHIGGFVPEKNHKGLIRIFNKILLEFPNAQLLLLGKGKLENEVRELVNNSNIEKNVHFLGHRNDVLNILNNSNAFVLPSLIEGLPAVILEAMYSMAPVVAYNVGGISEIVINNKTGWLVTKNDEKSFSKSLKESLKNNEEVNIIKENAKKMVTQRFSNDKIALRFERCYNEILTRPYKVPERKMKILQLVTKRQYRGAETFTCQLSNHLIKLGHTIKIISIFEGDAELPYLSEIISLHGTESSRFTDFNAWKRLSKIIKEFKPDIIQANAGDTFKYAVLSKILFRWKTPIVFRNASEVGRYLTNKFQKGFNSILYKNVDHVISVSEASKIDLISQFPFVKNRIEVIPIGLEEVAKIEDKELEPTGTRHIVHVGGFSFEKNHTGLLEIFEIVLKKFKNVHFHLVGDGSLRTEIECLAAQKGLTEKISFYGFVNNPLSYIKAGDVLVLPSIIEGLPGVLLEAMVCKVPVVAYDVGGISEIVTSSTGSLIQKNDTPAFAKAVIKALEAPNNEQIEAAYSMVKENYMNDEIALKFVNSYQKLVDGKQ